MYVKETDLLMPDNATHKINYKDTKGIQVELKLN